MKVWGRSGSRPDDEPHAAPTTTADSPAGKQKDSAAPVERSDLAQPSNAAGHDDSAAPESSNSAGMHEDSAGTPSSMVLPSRRAPRQRRRAVLRVRSAPI